MSTQEGLRSTYPYYLANRADPANTDLDVTVTPRSARRSSTSRKLRPKRW